MAQGKRGPGDCRAPFHLCLCRHLPMVGCRQRSGSIPATNSLSLPATPLRYPRFALCPDRSSLLWPRPPPFVPPRHYRPSPTESGVARVSIRRAPVHTRNEPLTAHRLCIFRSRLTAASRNKRQGGGGSLQTAVKGKPLNNPRKGCISAFNLFHPFTNRKPL